MKDSAPQKTALGSRTVDKLQGRLREEVFHYAADAKKAAGRALGTIVELITYYKIVDWGLTGNTLIERRIPEFANPSITHNVEFSLHRALRIAEQPLPSIGERLGARKIGAMFDFNPTRLSETLLCAKGTVRNAAVIAENEDSISVVNLNRKNSTGAKVCLSELEFQPVAIVECKRVGVEEGMKKGPQSIEKAKQGAYVARSVSALQKLRAASGEAHGYLPELDGSYQIAPYDQMLSDIFSGKRDVPQGFVLSIGVTSNHGNWFTSENHNKELRVLAQSYDWLLFLTDHGLMQFVEDCILEPRPEYSAIADAFAASYTGIKGQNRFTKVKIDLKADAALRDYFHAHRKVSDDWFEVIAPSGRSISALPDQLIFLIQSKKPT